MPTDLVDAYRRASNWAIERVEGATDKLDRPTPCDGWTVRNLLNHMLQTQQYFADSAQGKDAAMPTPEPPELISGDPAAQFRGCQADLLDAYAKPGVAEENPMGIGIAFSDMLIHGHDLAKATDQDATLPYDLAEIAYMTIKPNITDENRSQVFGPEVPVPDDAPADVKLLAFSGRDPSA